ncbi:MAG TPA: hypothetical protein VL381_01640 [Rhodocyclaceae bacterium]|jgi:hypothetical protein|nr:hypothetical protein [Rhodocyclaceae bacterium]
MTTRFCYHCQTHHPEELMRQVVTKSVRRWRCIKSIEAAKLDVASREAFGQRTSAQNKADSKSHALRINAMLLDR